MSTTSPPYAGYTRTSEHNEAHSSGVSWSAVFAGAFAAASLSLIFLALGAGLGVSSVSPWSNMGASTSTIGKGSIVWLIVIELLSSAMGGYLAGRLRTKWASIHNEEVYFRDTAHGFLAWSVALVLTAAFLTSAAATLVGSSASSTGSRTVSSESGNSALSPNTYFVDALFRSDAGKPETAGLAVRNEAGVIFDNALRARALSPADNAYLSQLVAAKTGMPSGEAGARVSQVFADAQQAEEATRKAIAHALIWIFIALLIGAFSASLAATIGGRQRDHVVTI